LNIKEALNIIANLGGYENKQKDKMPGYQIIWNGMQKLNTMKMFMRCIKSSGYTINFSCE